VRALERSGYSSSLDGAIPAPLQEALAHAPTRRAARPHPQALWRAIAVDEEGGRDRPSARPDDRHGRDRQGPLCGRRGAPLGPYTRFVIDCGGDIAVGGVGAQLEPYRSLYKHPISGESIGVVRLAKGGVATSGLNVRIWRNRDDSFGHHLLDPSTGGPAWTGLVGATAIGDSALEAETLSKMALLLGPERARQVLASTAA